MQMEITFYKRSNGKSPIEEFLNKLLPENRARVVACLASIKELGFTSPRVNFRSIKNKLWEVKIRTSEGGIRIFYVTLKNGELVLLHCYKKQSQKAPKKEIATAEKRMLEILKNE